MKKLNNQQLHAISKKVKQLVLDISYTANTDHVGSALSIADLLTVLYFNQLNISKVNIKSDSRDRFILSKGHAAAALYAVLYLRGIISESMLNTFANDQGGLCKHPEVSTAGIEMATGSLGHGLGFGVGIAVGLVKSNNKSRVYVLISDAECDEGSTWEGALLASHLKLKNLTVILDYNQYQCCGKVKDILNLEPLIDKWIAFGWKVFEINGHDVKSIRRAFSKCLHESAPQLLLAHTRIGKDISLIQDSPEGHSHFFSEEEYQKAKKELGDI